MVEERGFIGIIKDTLSFIPQIISASIISPISEGTEVIMRNIEHRIIRMERRILKNISSLVIIGFGGLLLTFAFYFSLREFLGWSNAAAFFAVGIIVFVIGLLLKAGRSER